MDKGAEGTTRMANTQTLYQSGNSPAMQETRPRQINADEMFSDTSFEAPEKDRSVDDQRTGGEIASEIIQRAKEDGPSHALHDLGEGKVFSSQEYKTERQDSNTSTNERDSTNVDNNKENQEPKHTKEEQKFDLKMYNAIWKDIYEEKVKTGGEIDIDAINNQAESEYREYQEYKAAKEEQRGIEKSENSKDELFQNQKELTPEQKIIHLQDHVKELSQTQREMKEELAKTRDDYETLRQSVITLAEAFTAYLELEKKKKKDGDEISFLEILIKLVNKLLTEMFTLDEYTEKSPKKSTQEPTFKILHTSDDKQSPTNIINMDDYKKKKPSKESQPQEEVRESA